VAAETNDSRRTFTAGGETYEYPDPFDLDLDEWVVIYDETGLILEDFAPFDDKKREETRLQQLRNPALIKALAICGIIREHPQTDIDSARELAGDMKMLDVLKSLAGGEDDADDPTQESQSATEESSLRTSGDISESSSPDSPKTSDEPEGELPATGTGG
jgi:hypothetical protein